MGSAFCSGVWGKTTPGSLYLSSTMASGDPRTLFSDLPLIRVGTMSALVQGKDRTKVSPWLQGCENCFLRSRVPQTRGDKRQVPRLRCDAPKPVPPRRYLGEVPRSLPQTQMHSGHPGVRVKATATSTPRPTAPNAVAHTDTRFLPGRQTPASLSAPSRPRPGTDMGTEASDRHRCHPTLPCPADRCLPPEAQDHTLCPRRPALHRGVQTSLLPSPWVGTHRNRGSHRQRRQF